jgi:hypothetical protein
LIVSTLRPPVFDRNILILDVPVITLTSLKIGKVLAVGFWRCEVKKSDHRHGWLLRARQAAMSPPNLQLL